MDEEDEEDDYKDDNKRCICNSTTGQYISYIGRYISLRTTT